MTDSGLETADNIVALVLAAGRSARHSSGNKLLLPYQDATVVRKAVETVVAAGFHEIVVVTGHQSDQVCEALSGLRIRTVRNRDYVRGMGSSLSTGLGAVEPVSGGYAVFLGDMPSIRTDTISLLKQRFFEEVAPVRSIVRPVYEGKAGHPVILGAAYRSEMLALGRDAGARSVIDGHRHRLVPVEVDDAGILADIDTVEDYRRLTASS